jgi:uncharacterized protein YbjT (DUF2867 family)
MKITLTGSLGNISKPLAEILVKQGHEVTVISSQADKANAIEALGAKAAIGSVTDVAFLTGAFKGADAIYTMVPPNFGAADYRGYMNSIGSNYAEAIAASGVKKVVNLSSIGADLPEGTGPIAGLHDVENKLNTLQGVDIMHLRAGFFYVNFFHDISIIKNANIMGNNFSNEAKLVMVHPNDIAAAVAKELQTSFTGKNHKYVVSDERVISDVVTALGSAIKKPELPWIEFTDEQAYEGMTKAGMPEVIAKTYVEMGTAVRSGILWQDYNKNKPATYGDTKLEDFAKEFAGVYN